jgi:hypothetical protein
MPFQTASASHGLSPDRPFQAASVTKIWLLLPHPARIALTLHGAHNGCEGTDAALICAFASSIIYSINMAFVIRMKIIVNQ